MHRIIHGGILVLLSLPLALAATDAEATLARLGDAWRKPARTCKPHTRWWWPGNALTPADITWQLEQMAAQGMGGVEIMSAWRMYAKGNHEFLSPGHLDLVRHAVAEARRLDLDVAITFSPGWSFGGSWVAKEDQSKVLTMGSVTVTGGSRHMGALPRPVFKAAHKGDQAPADGGTVVAVVAGRVTEGTALAGESLTVITTAVEPGTENLAWEVPPGTWRIMAFRLLFTGQECQAQSSNPPAMVIDHLSQGAVQRYCDHLGGVFKKTIGDAFGTTVDSFFCDSFEIHPLAQSLLWSTDTLAGFTAHAGYDLTRYLPALWCDVGPLTPRIRYDVGDYLHHRGLQTVFKVFDDWCRGQGVQARIQPHYRFTQELVQGAGAVARPETEVTTARFEPIADPRKATASGARFYGRDIVSAESYTFIHPARYRTDLQDLKIATDAFLRDGVTQFYNHGYFASPEMHVAPSRDMPWANRISHWNTWWPYYHQVAGYVARSCSLLRQGRLVADVLIYAPQATAWSERALWGNDRRVLPYGDLAKTLVANGYDFDIVNDDLLVNAATVRDGIMEINGHERRILILPRATVVPIATMRAMARFAAAGGTIIALEQLPVTAAGMRDHQKNDKELKEIVQGLFSGGGKAVFLPAYAISRMPFSPMRQPYKPTPALHDAQRQLLAVLGRVAPPDFAPADRAQSDGLTFIHKRVDAVDVYFVTNLQPARIATDVVFRVSGKVPQRWDAVTGAIAPVPGCQAVTDSIRMPLAFEPWESAFFVFAPGALPAVSTAAPPAEETMAVTGTWRMKLVGHGFESYEADRPALTSWTDDPRTRHFSGTGRYDIDLTVPERGLRAGTRVVLDLGQVGNIAEVALNGQAVGVAWMAPHRLDVTRAVRAGSNHLVVQVTNTLINHVTGLKEPPEVPAALQPRLGPADPAIYPHSKAARKEMGETDLPPSGLMGPVRLVMTTPAGP